MTIYKKPDAQAFAEDAPSSEITTFTAWLRGLGIAFDETNGFPQMEGINDVLNRITQGIKYLEQYGIPLWRSDLEYPVGASVLYNGVQYRCIAQNTNAQPDLSQLSWQSAIVDNLKSNSTAQSLSAKQGKVLADMLSGDDNTQKLGNKLLQWGYVEVTPNTTTKVQLHSVFPTSALIPMVCLGSILPTGYYYSAGADLSTSEITITLSSNFPNKIGVRWIAIGN